MKTKQVLELTAVFLGKEDLLNCAYFTGTQDEISPENQKELDLLLRCLNLITSEISTDYLPIYKTKTIDFVDNICHLEDVDENIYQIVKLQDEFGSEIRFKIIGNDLKANATTCQITYTSFAQKTTLDGNVETFSIQIPERVLAYGTAMEYSFISSLYDDASVWESRYKNGLLSISQKKHNLVMPKRRWL